MCMVRRCWEEIEIEKRDGKGAAGDVDVKNLLGEVQEKRAEERSSAGSSGSGSGSGSVEDEVLVGRPTMIHCGCAVVRACCEDGENAGADVKV